MVTSTSQHHTNYQTLVTNSSYLEITPNQSWLLHLISKNRNHTHHQSALAPIHAIHKGKIIYCSTIFFTLTTSCSTKVFDTKKFSYYLMRTIRTSYPITLRMFLLNLVFIVFLGRTITSCLTCINSKIPLPILHPLDLTFPYYQMNIYIYTLALTHICRHFML